MENQIVIVGPKTFENAKLNAALGEQIVTVNRACTAEEISTITNIMRDNICKAKELLNYVCA